MKIGLRIKNLREERGYSQGELARRVGVTQPTVSDWENNKTEPAVDNLRILATELEVFFEWLATGRGPQQYSPQTSGPHPPTRSTCWRSTAACPRRGAKPCWSSSPAGHNGSAVAMHATCRWLAARDRDGGGDLIVSP